MTVEVDPPYERDMSAFPSLEWCKALIRSLEKEPGIAEACREWGGRSIGVVIGSDADLASDFCVFAKPHPTEPRVEDLRVCEDEDDLELEEPDYLFRLPHGLAVHLLHGKLDPLDVLRKGKVRVEGDFKFLLSFGHKHRLLGERAVARLGSE